MWIKRWRHKLLPRSLLYRMILIIIIPAIVSQSISLYIFYNKHWDNISKYMVYTLAGEVAFISKIYPKIRNKDLEHVSSYVQYNFTKNAKLKLTDSRKLPRELKILKSNIQYALPGHDFNIRMDNEASSKEVIIDVKVNNGVLSFSISPRRILFSSTYTFLLWVCISTLILLAITIIFARNQISSITKLGDAAKNVTQGHSILGFTPTGAIEVRTAGYALIQMKQKLEEEVQQKIKMLAGVSHDIKTPITRIKLQLELMDEDDNVRDIRGDLLQLEKTLNDYLDFARGEDLTARNIIDLEELLAKLTKNHGNITIKMQDKIKIDINENQIVRALGNFIENAKKFATKVMIKVYERDKEAVIEIHDDGPGIPKRERAKVFMPFYRIERSRNRDTGGVGLGLSIARDIILRHNGAVSLHSSSLGGLMVLVRLPII